jgi:hypothetical protein
MLLHVPITLPYLTLPYLCMLPRLYMMLLLLCMLDREHENLCLGNIVIYWI